MHSSVKHHANPQFWKCYYSLPQSIQKLADENYDLLKSNLHHPSLHFKKVGRFCSVRVGRRYRVLGVESGQNIVWFWIGTHSEYDILIK
ncbi:MAG: hypothetical protein PHR77_18430 [Kiritimatiellae bacterium]|nr:hypothetical protein [Kiritimatiellia bacterium]MDD5521625.1 hypothetical protein [Kiritimatiellia bacterium]